MPWKLQKIIKYNIKLGKIQNKKIQDGATEKLFIVNIKTTLETKCILPSTGSSCDMVNWVSPVPGGISITR